MFDATTEEKQEELTNRMNDFVIALFKQNIQPDVIGHMDCPLCNGVSTVSYTRGRNSRSLRAYCSSCGVSLMS